LSDPAVSKQTEKTFGGGKTSDIDCLGQAVTKPASMYNVDVKYGNMDRNSACELTVGFY